MITFTLVLLENLTEGKKKKNRLETFQWVFWWKNTPHVKIKTFGGNVLISMYFWWVSPVNVPNSSLMYCQAGWLLCKPNSCLPGGLPEPAGCVGSQQHRDSSSTGEQNTLLLLDPAGLHTQSCSALLQALPGMVLRAYTAQTAAERGVHAHGAGDHITNYH